MAILTSWGKRVGERQQRVVVMGIVPGPIKLTSLYFSFQYLFLICSVGTISPPSSRPDWRINELIFVKHLKEPLHRQSKHQVNDKEETAETGDHPIPPYVHLLYRGEG